MDIEKVKFVMKAIFEADKTIHPHIGERHFIVASRQYEAEARAAISAVEEFERSKAAVN